MQYADKPDKVLEGRARYYRAALSRLRHAVTECNRADLVAVLHLGDIVDGNCSDAETSKDFSSVLRAFSRLRHPALHVIGNHCHDVGRERLLREMATSPGATPSTSLRPSCEAHRLQQESAQLMQPGAAPGSPLPPRTG